MDELRKMQLMLTNMLKVFHDFCIENSLRYYAIGGTALGAARHQGFIPWDDDVDIGMPRPDYERFIKLFNEKNNNRRYVVESPYSSAQDYSYPYSKVFDTYTLLKEDARIPFVRGIFIDVFPLDGVGNDLMKAKKKCKKIKKIIYLRNARTNRINKKSKTYRIITKWIIQHIPSFIINEKRLAIRIDNECKEYDFDSSEYLANLMGAWNEKEIIPKSVMGIPQLLPFENTSIYCPLKIDEYLRQIYGDWRTPPPKDKRKSTHHCVFDMTKPYLDINNN